MLDRLTQSPMSSSALEPSVSSPGGKPQSPVNIVEALSGWAAQTPQATAFQFIDPDPDQERSLSFAQLDYMARQLGEILAAQVPAGARGLLMFPPGLDFLVGFFGCLYAGCVAVPAFPPRRNRKGARILGIAEDCEARFALTVQAVQRQIEQDQQSREGMQSMQLFSVDTLAWPKPLAERDTSVWSPRRIDSAQPAVLQYTSGSTGRPKGVILTHHNLVSNAKAIGLAFGIDSSAIGVSWLPTYHDMGLIGGILAPLFSGRPCGLMSPMSFLQKPLRWLQTITRLQATISGGPNFAYQLCVDKILPEEMAELDLSSWKVAFNGAEPVRASTLEQFATKFASVGFRPGAALPCYGMAESTLLITGGPRERLPVIRTYDAKGLDQRKAVRCSDGDPSGRALVGCGEVAKLHHVQIVDPETRLPLSDGQIGEIWVQGPSIGQGYWEKQEESAETFQAYTADGSGPFLRTGDLGFLDDAQLYVAGRVKDLIIVRGVNRYPQDIEQTVEECHPSLPACSAAAFADHSGPRERLILAVEVQRGRDDDWHPVLQAIRRSVTEVHELPPDAIFLVRYGSLPKTSSGKIQRHACLQAFREGSLRTIAKWAAWEESTQPAQPPMIAAASFNADGQAMVGRSTGVDSLVASPTPLKEDRDPDMEIVQVVLRAVRAVAQERATELHLDTNIILDLGLDSLERLQIAHSLETTFGGRFPEEELQEIETVREIAEALERNFGKSRLRLDAAPVEITEPTEPRTNISPEHVRFDRLPEYQRLKQTMTQFELAGEPNPYFSVHQGLTRDTTRIDDRDLISFASYNYLGMSGDPVVCDAVVDAVRQFGSSVSASRLVSGEKTLHRELERTLADWIGVQDAVVMVGGHATNETVIGHMVGPGDLILHDALSHNSIVQGAMLSGARRRAFNHNDWEHLEALLQQLRGSYRRVLVVIEGVYSMDGDFPSLPDFIRIKQQHQCWLMVDEAHSIGTLGATGRGIAEHFGVDPQHVDIWMGTLSKSFGSCGGYIAGDTALVELLKYTAPGFVFSVGLSPPNAAAALAAVKLLKRSPERVQRLRANSALFLSEAKRLRINTGFSQQTPVIPAITGNSLEALQLSRRLFESGINVQPILYPAVEESAARLRFFINSTHSEDQIRYTVQETARHYRELTGRDSWPGTKRPLS